MRLSWLRERIVSWISTDAYRSNDLFEEGPSALRNKDTPTANNHALDYAIEKANEMSKPLVVFFGITEQYPEANERHYWFMLEGLKEVKQEA